MVVHKAAEQDKGKEFLKVQGMLELISWSSRSNCWLESNPFVYVLVTIFQTMKNWLVWVFKDFK